MVKQMLPISLSCQLAMLIGYISDLDPVPPHMRSWGGLVSTLTLQKPMRLCPSFLMNQQDYWASWTSDMLAPPLASVFPSVMALGFTARETIPIVFFGVTICSVVITLTGNMGAQYSIVFPVIIRSVFGMYGFYLEFCLRAFAAAAMWTAILCVKVLAPCRTALRRSGRATRDFPAFSLHTFEWETNNDTFQEAASTYAYTERRVDCRAREYRRRCRRRSESHYQSRQFLHYLNNSLRRDKYEPYKWSAKVTADRISALKVLLISEGLGHEISANLQIDVLAV